MEGKQQSRSLKLACGAWLTFPLSGRALTWVALWSSLWRAPARTSAVVVDFPSPSTRENREQ